MDKNMKLFLELIEQSTRTYGNYRSELITALESDKAPTYTEPKAEDQAYLNTVDKLKDEIGWQNRQMLLNAKFTRALEDYENKREAYDQIEGQQQ